MSNKLNNKVVIPAKNSIDFPTVSLSKNNVIDKVNVKNGDFLKMTVVNNDKNPFVFAKCSLVEGTSTSDWVSVYEGTIRIDNKSQNFVNKTVVDSSKTQGASLARMAFSLKTTVSAGKIDKTVEDSFKDIPLAENSYQEYTQTLKGGVFSPDIVTVLTRFTFENGTISVGIRISGKSNDIDFSKIEHCYCRIVFDSLELASSAVDIYEPKEDIGFGFYEAKCNLAEGDSVVTIPNLSWHDKITCKADYVNKNATEEMIGGPFDAVVLPTLFSSIKEFLEGCKEYFSTINEDEVGSIGCIVGFRSKEKKFYAGHLRFEEGFSVYVCVQRYDTTAPDFEAYFDDFSLTFFTKEAKRYSKDDSVITVGENGGKSFDIQGNSLMQDETTINGIRANTAVANTVLNTFKNGRAASNSSIFFGEYLDFEGKAVYNNENGYFVKVDDIVVPYTIRTVGVNGEPLEVPLLSNKTENTGKQFVVTSSGFEYDGDFVINLEMLENNGSIGATGSGSGGSSGGSGEGSGGSENEKCVEHLLFVPMLPIGVARAGVTIKESLCGNKGVVIEATNIDQMVTVYEGDELEIFGVADVGYNNPIVSLSSNVVNGDVTAYITAGTKELFTVSFDLNGGTASGIPSQLVVEYGTTIYLDEYDTPYRSDDGTYSYLFDHWEHPETGSSFTVYSDVVVVARYYRRGEPEWINIPINQSADTTSSTNIYNSSVKSVPTRFYTGTDGRIDLKGDGGYSYGKYYTLNAGGGAVGGSSNSYSASGSNVYGAGFGYSLTANNGSITFSAWARSFQDDNEEYGTESTQVFSFSNGHITIVSVDQLIQNSANGIV